MTVAKSFPPLMEAEYSGPLSEKVSGSYRSERLIKPLTVIGCIVTLACLASTAANIYFYTMKSQMQSSTPPSCFQCAEVDGYPVDWAKVRVKDDICCMEQSDFLRLVEKVSLNAAKSELASALPAMPIGSSGRGSSKLRPSAHLGLGPQPPWTSKQTEADSCSGSGSTSEVKNWRLDSNGHIRGDLNYRNGRITVNSTGYYHVYSQVSSEDRSSSASRPPQRHSVFRLNPLSNEPEELLTSEVTRCKDVPVQGTGGSGTNNPLASSYVGAALLLFKGDQIFVKVSCIENLKENGPETYFGMYLV